jgi:hypothetical protein
MSMRHSSKAQPTMRRILREKHGVWRGALFPDFAGAAETVASAFQRCGGHQKPSMSFDRDKFLDEHIRYRLTHLDVFHCALEIVSTQPEA